MNKVIKSILYIVGALIVLVAVFWCSIVYVTEYKITTCDTAVSPDEQYKLILQAVGEPDWPFGSASGRKKMIRKFPMLNLNCAMMVEV